MGTSWQLIISGSLRFLWPLGFVWILRCFKDFFLTQNEEVEVDKKAKSIAKIKAKLKKESQLVKSATTGATIDVLPDAQATQMQADLAKKGVKTTKTKV